MAKELDAILDHGEANPAASCRTESGSVSFLDQIILPIYETLAAVSGPLFQICLLYFLSISLCFVLDFGIGFVVISIMVCMLSEIFVKIVGFKYSRIALIN